MPNDDTALERLENTAVIEKTEWDRIAQEIRNKQAEIEAEFGKAPREYVRKRKGAGGKEWEYVREDLCTKAMNKHVPDWCYATPTIQFFSEKQGYPKPEFVASSSIAFTIAGVRRVVGGVGSKQVEFTTQESEKVRNENGSPAYIIVPVPGAAKAADTDCFKRCCFRALRLAADIYRKIDEEQYAQFTLRPGEIEILKLHEQKLEKILPELVDPLATKARIILQEIRKVLEEPNEAVRYEAIDLAKQSKAIQDNWRKNHAS